MQPDGISSSILLFLKIGWVKSAKISMIKVINIIHRYFCHFFEMGTYRKLAIYQLNRSRRFFILWESNEIATVFKDWSLRCRQGPAVTSTSSTLFNRHVQKIIWASIELIILLTQSTSTASRYRTYTWMMCQLNGIDIPYQPYISDSIIGSLV